MNSEIRFYLSIFLRRMPVFAVVAISISAVGIATAMLVPTRYSADALLLMESPQIPDELAASTVQTNAREQLEIIEQRLMTRINLIEIADDFGVFPDRASMFPDEVVEEMRDRTAFRITTGRDRASLVRVEFESQNPAVTAAVVNEYVTRILESNVELRTDRAEDTMDFFEAEVARLGQDLERQSQRILDFKNANINALPESLDYRLSRQSTLQERLAQVESEIAGLREQRERAIMIYTATASDSREQVDTRSASQRELDALESELKAALAVYSEQNPRVKVLRTRIAALEAAVAEESTEEEEAPESEPVSILDIQLSEIDARAETLIDQKARIERELAILARSIAETPGNAIALESLERDYQNIQSQYNSAVARMSAAATGERIELLSKGQRISVINPAAVPRRPSSPNRPLIAAVGIALGLGAGAGLVLLLELLNRSIRRPVDLTRSLGIVPIATLPLVRTPGETARRRAVLGLVLLTAAIGIPLALYFFHMTVMPIDLAFDKVMDRLPI